MVEKVCLKVKRAEGEQIYHDQLLVEKKRLVDDKHEENCYLDQCC